jgi:hypothetical protein
MKNNVSRENSTLLKISMIVFIGLLAIYIPLKIYISYSNNNTALQGEISLKIFVTHNIWLSNESPVERGPFTETKSYNSRSLEYGNTDKHNTWAKSLFDSLKSIRAKNHALLVDLCGIGYHSGENKYSIFPEFSKEARVLNYDAIATGMPDNINYFLNLIKSDYSSLPFTSVNIINDDGKRILKKWIIKEIKGVESKTGDKVKIKIGIFSVTFADSYSDQNLREPRNLINPKIASLEAVTKMENEMCNLIIALSETSPGNSIDLARSVHGIDLVINASKSGKGTQCRSIPDSYIFDISENSPYLQEINIRLAKDSLIVIPCEQVNTR